jgi:preprotein translocase subunit SecA
MDRMGLKEGEVIQHSMMTKSIERAQKKVEENNFGVRKRLLEYDDVMNSQREVIYRRRRNALYGERLELDVQHIIYQAITDAASANPGKENEDRFHLRLVHLFGFNPSTEGLDLSKLRPTEIANKLYPVVAAHYRAHINELGTKTLAVIEQIERQHGPQPFPIGLPFQTPKVGMQVSVDVAEAKKNAGPVVRQGLEQFSSLAMIDQAWKEHLREMDELRQSVQNASLEQKDPLLVYKFEAVKLFRSFLADVNEQIITFLYRAELPELQTMVSPAPAAPRVPQVPMPQGASAGQEVHNEVDSILNALRAQQAGQANEQLVLDEESMEAARPKAQPVRVAQAPNRNDKVTVRYFATGQLKQAKFKQVEEDVKRGLCMVVDMA